MPQLPVSIHGKIYNINCPDHEKEKILKMSEYVNYKISQVAPKCKSMNDITLLSFTLLAVADDVAKAYDSNERLEAKIKDIQKQPNTEFYVKEIDNLKKKLAVLNEVPPSSSDHAELFAEITRLKEENEQLKQIQPSSPNNEIYEQEIARLNAEIIELKQYSDNLTNNPIVNAEAYEAEIAYLKAENENLKQAGGEHHEIHKTYQLEITELKKEIVSLSEISSEEFCSEIYMEEIRSLKQQLAQAKSNQAQPVQENSHEPYLAEIGGLKEEITSLKQALTHAIEQKPQTEPQLEIKINQPVIDSMLNMIKELSTEIKASVPS